MKKITILIMILCVSHFGVTQNSKSQDSISKNLKSSTPKADELFDRMWYKDAAKLYERELRKRDKKASVIDTSNDYKRLLKKAGDAYFFNTDMKNANRLYNKLISNFYSSVDAESMFRYAHSLEGVGRYEEAKLWMKKFSEKAEEGDDRSETYNQDAKPLEDVLSIKPQFILHNLSINTESSDFGPMYYRDKLIYSSAVDSSNYHTRIYHWNKLPFLNMYVGYLNETESDVKKIGEFSENLNTRYHEATLAFSPDYKRVYFTRNNYNGRLVRDTLGTNHLKLYSADLIVDNDSIASWQNVQELPFNSDDYSVGHPALSKDGKQLYFVSDMPGSIGGTDIFVVDIYETEAEEVKEVDSDRFIIDVKLDKGISYSTPRNIGETINTKGREMFPYITDNTLYFASDGHLGLGGLDVFGSHFNAGEEFEKPKNLGAPLNSKLDDFSFIIKEDEDRGFVASNRPLGKGDDDIYSFIRIATKEPIKKESLEIIIEEPVCNQLVKGYVSNDLTGERIADVTVDLYDGLGQKTETVMTNLNGAYDFSKLLECNEEYKVVAFKRGYRDKEKVFITEKEGGETKVNLGLEMLNELIVEEGGQLKIKIGMLYFNLGKANIRKDASVELDKIVELMKEYPKMIIKIESHTDSRGSGASNLSLSDRRAKSTKKYIVSQGISETRIESANGYGESRLINECSDGVSCSDLKHQMNRRSEFIILSM